ncbi:MAG: HAD family phosphatase [Clostridia bacterium]|nr:HAD family phosphatase [Clostridia bacterium]
MDYKIIALDIDGTLTNSDKIITAETQEKLIEFQKNGGKLILASGRPTMGIVPHAQTLRLKEFGGYILAYNGGCVIDCSSGKIVFQDKLPLSVVPEICDVIKNYPVGINTYEGKNIIVGNDLNKYTRLEAKINGMDIQFVENFTEYVNFDINKLLLQGEPEYILELEKILSEKYKGQLGVFKSEAFFLEIVPSGIDKAMSIDRLLKLIGIKTEECIACGDGFNDISMIKYAGLGVAMSNAKEPVKEAADYITLSNDEDGIAHLIMHISKSHKNSPIHAR